MKIVGWLVFWLVLVGFGVPLELVSERSFLAVVIWGGFLLAALEIARRQEILHKIHIVLWWVMWFAWSLLGYAFEAYGHESYRETTPIGVFFLGAILLTCFYLSQKRPQKAASGSLSSKLSSPISTPVSVQEHIARLQKAVSLLNKDNESQKQAIQEIRLRLSAIEKKRGIEVGIVESVAASGEIAGLDIAAKEAAEAATPPVAAAVSLSQQDIAVTPQALLQTLKEVNQREESALAQVLTQSDQNLAPTKRVETQQEAGKSQEAAKPQEQMAEPIEISIGPVPGVSYVLPAETGKEIVPASADKSAKGPVAAAVKSQAAHPVIVVGAKKQALRSKPSAASLETFVGEKLLSYVGIGILVLGLAFLLVYSLTRMGPGGRVATGVVCGGALLMLGNFLEKKPNFILFGRILMAGGWATIYFTAFGAHSIPEMKVIADRVAGTLVLAIVAAAMLAHTLKYASEPLTGTALLLAYITLFIFHDVTLYTQIAAFVLAVLIAVFTWKFRWFRMQLCGIVLLYVGYGILLYLQGKKSLPQDQGEYVLATVLLIGLWLSFKAPDFSKPRHIAYENYMMPMLDVMNLFGLAIVRKISHVMFQTQGSPKSSLTLGLVLIAMAQILRVIDRKRLYRLDSTLGMALLMVAGWCWFDNYSFCMLSWLCLGMIAFGYSLYRDDRYFRDLGHVVAALGTLLVLGGETPKQLAMFVYQFFTGELWLTPGQTSLPSRTAITPLASGLVGGLGAILLYFTGFVSFTLAKARQRWHDAEKRRESIVTILATFAMMVACYKILTPYQAVFAWLGLGILVFQYGSARQEFYLHALSHVVILWSMCCGPILQLNNNQIGHTMGAGALVLYWNGYLTYRLAKKGLIKQQESDIERIMTILATAFMMIATGVRFDYFEGTLTWLALGAFLFYYGIFREANFIRYLSHGVLVGAACRGLLPIMGVALPGTEDTTVTIVGNWQASRSVISLAFVVALFYLHGFLLNFFRQASRKTEELVLEECFIATVANIVLFTVLWYTLPATAIAIAYTIAGVIFLECGQSWQRPYLQTHSVVALSLSAFWLFTVNIGAQGYIGGISRRLLSSVPVLACWVYAISGWQKLLASGQRTLVVEEKYFPSVLSYLNFAAIVSLIYYEPWAFHDGFGWALYGLILLLVPMLIRHSRYALQALIVLGMASFSVCGIAGRIGGASGEYLRAHPALILSPLALLAAHLVCKIFRSLLDNSESPLAGTGLQLQIMHYSRKLYAVIFCVVVTLVATMLSAKPYYSFTWGIEAFLFGWYGLAYREKSFRWSALILFALAVCKIVLYDVFSFTTEEKIVTFIGVGIALLSVSFMYHRLKEQLAKFLLED
jgi:hypothetical protein